MTNDRMSCEIKKKAKTDNCYTVTFKGMTRGMIFAIKNALNNYPTSAVAQDVNTFLFMGMSASSDPQVKELLNP